MPLRTDALNRGTQNLINVDTHIEKGSKIAKGQENLTGVMSQFSSLMSVMEEDFSIMNDMQREYSSEKSEVSPDLPEELIQNIPDRVSTDEETSKEVIPELSAQNVLEIPEEKTLSTMAHLLEVPIIDEGIDLVSREMVSPIIVVEDYTPSIVESNAVVSVVTQSPLLEPITVQQSNNISILEPKNIQLPNVTEVPQVLADEIIQSMNQIVVETIVEDGSDMVETIEQPELPQFIREGFRLLDENVIPTEQQFEEPVEPLVNDNEPLRNIVKADNEVSPIAKPIIQNDVNTFVQSIGAVIASSTQVNPVVTNSADGVSIQQTKSASNNKLPKMPKLQQTSNFFEKNIDEKQEAGTEKMSFSSKLIQRLEMVIMDPLGRLDVEVAQEMMGIQVKAIAPSEMMSSLLGLEQDLQIALDGHGIDLSSFELEERREELDSSGSSNGLDKEVADTNEELEEKLPMGGMLLSRRV